MKLNIDPTSWHARVSKPWRDAQKTAHQRKRHRAEAALNYEEDPIGPFQENTCSYIRALVIMLALYAAAAVVVMFLGTAFGSGIAESLGWIVSPFNSFADWVTATLTGLAGIMIIMSLAFGLVTLLMYLSTVIPKWWRRIRSKSYQAKMKKLAEELKQPQEQNLASHIRDYHNKICKPINIISVKDTDE